MIFDKEFSRITMVYIGLIMSFKTICHIKELVEDYKVIQPNISSMKAFIKFIENDLVAYQNVLDCLTVLEIGEP